MRVFVLDKNKKPLDPCHPARARKLLRDGRARVFRRYPFIVEVVQPLLITAKGHGTRQQCRTDKYGFPSRYCSKQKVHFGFRTGDIVKAIVTKGKKIGTYLGRVATRASGSFNISTKNGLIQGISYKYCQIVHGKDGYQYAFL